MKGRGCCCSFFTSNIFRVTTKYFARKWDFLSFYNHPTLIRLLGPGKLLVWLSFQQHQPNPVFSPPEILTDDSALPQSPAMSLGLLYQPELCSPCPHFSCHTPHTPGSTDPLLPSAPWCGSLAEVEKEKKNQPAIWNLNETKFISLCCHFIFHRFDGEGTGDPRGPFCFAHRVERGKRRKEGRG